MIYASDHIEEVLGVPQVDILGQDATDFIHPEDHQEFEKHLEYDPTSPPAATRQGGKYGPDTVIQVGHLFKYSRVIEYFFSVITLLKGDNRLRNS